MPTHHDVVIDVSNVCWDHSLPPAGNPGDPPRWERLERLIQAWRDARDPDATVVLVADNALLHSLRDADKDRLEEYAIQGRLLSRKVADTLILEHAERHGMQVLSRDRFVDHRVEHPWIERSPGRFHSWEANGERIRIIPSGITWVPRQYSSEAGEIKSLRAQGIDPKKHRDLLNTRWRCLDTMCAEARKYQGVLLLLPKIVNGVPVCPSCSKVVVALGQRGLVRQLVVSSYPGGAELLRIPIEAGVPLTLGRGEVPNGVNLAGIDGVDPDSIAWVSRSHLLLFLEELGSGGIRLTAVDLRSRNGTKIVRRDRDGYGMPAPVVPDRPVYLGGTDYLMIANCLRVDLSGRRFVPDTRWPDTGASGGGETMFRPDQPT